MSAARSGSVELVKRYGDVVAVDGIDAADPGRRVLHDARPVGLRQDDDAAADRGLRAARRGRDPARRRSTCRARRRTSGRVNTVFQSYALFPHMTVRRQRGLRPALPARAPRPSARGGSARRWRWCSSAGCEARRPAQLSGGQQQRVALARALVLEPPVLLLDEPLGALDARLRVDLQVELKRIQETLGITFVYVTHDQDEALTMSDRVAVMRGGRIEQCGEPRALYEEPETAFVANFLGASNLIPVASVDATARLALGGLQAAAPTCATGAGRRRDGDDPAGAGAAGAARAPRARTACRGWSRRSSTSASTRSVRVRLATGALVRGDVPNDGTAVEYAQGDPVSCTARHLRAPELPAACLEPLMSRPRTHARSAAADGRRVDRAPGGFAAAPPSARSRARRARRLGLLQLPLRLQGRGRRRGVRGGGARGPRRRCRRSRAATRTRRTALAAYLDQSDVGGPRGRGGCGSTRGASPSTPPLRARHARALRRRLARGAGRACSPTASAAAAGACADPQDTRRGLVAVLDGHRPAHHGPRRRRRRPSARRAGRAGWSSSSSASRCPRPPAPRRPGRRAGRARDAHRDPRRATSTPPATSIPPSCSRTWRRPARPGSARGWRRWTRRRGSRSPTSRSTSARPAAAATTRSSCAARSTRLGRDRRAARARRSTDRRRRRSWSAPATTARRRRRRRGAATAHRRRARGAARDERADARPAPRSAATAAQISARARSIGIAGSLGERADAVAVDQREQPVDRALGPSQP